MSINKRKCLSVREKVEIIRDDKVSLLDAIYLMKDAWETVTPATVSNCFRKVGLLSDVSVNNQTVIEDDLLFLSG
jgi:hypothetical protein